jgi:hypothetical protein
MILTLLSIFVHVFMCATFLISIVLGANLVVHNRILASLNLILTLYCFAMPFNQLIAINEPYNISFSHFACCLGSLWVVFLMLAYVWFASIVLPYFTLKILHIIWAHIIIQLYILGKILDIYISMECE